MCYAALIPLAMAAAGAGANYASQRSVNREREKILGIEGDRQESLQNQANNVINQNLAQSAPAAQNQALAMAGQERQTALGANDAQGVTLPTSGSAPVEVKGEIARQMSDAIKSSRSKLGAQARLGAFNQVQDANNARLRRGGADLSLLGNLSAGSSGVLPYELSGAANAGRGWRSAADLFNLGAQATSMYQQTNMPTAGPSQPSYVDLNDPTFSATGGYSPIGTYSPVRTAPRSILSGGR